MINQIYTILDKVLEESGPIFEAKNDGVAMRHFDQLIENVTNPQDFDLLHIGSIDHDKDENLLISHETRIVKNQMKIQDVKNSMEK